MITEMRVEQVTFATQRSFDEVVAIFEAEVGALETIGWPSITSGRPDRAEFERRVQAVLGRSGFTRFLTIDHGEWLTMLGRPTKFIMYTIGNPLIAITMLDHDIGAGLDVPVRLAIYEHPNGGTRLVFDKPSTLMSSLASEPLHAAALKLDAKLLELGETVTGVMA